MRTWCEKAPQGKWGLLFPLHNSRVPPHPVKSWGSKSHRTGQLLSLPACSDLSKVKTKNLPTVPMHGSGLRTRGKVANAQYPQKPQKLKSQLFLRREAPTQTLLYTHTSQPETALKNAQQYPAQPLLCASCP